MRTLTLVWLLMLLMLLGPTDSIRAQEGEPSTQIRFVHALPGGAAVDIYLDGERIVAGLPAGEATAYGRTDVGGRELRLLPANGAGTTPLLSEEVTLNSGRSYTFALTGGQEGGVQGLLFEDDIEPAGNEQGSIRVVHLARPVEQIAAAADEAALTPLLEFGEASERLPIEGEQPVITIIDEAGQPLLASPAIPIQGGQFYTIFVAGVQEGLQPLIVSYPLSGSQTPSAQLWLPLTAETAGVEAQPAQTLPEVGADRLDPSRSLWLVVGGMLLILLARALPAASRGAA